MSICSPVRVDRGAVKRGCEMWTCLWLCLRPACPCSRSPADRTRPELQCPTLRSTLYIPDQHTINRSPSSSSLSFYLILEENYPWKTANPLLGGRALSESRTRCSTGRSHWMPERQPIAISWKVSLASCNAMIVGTLNHLRYTNQEIQLIYNSNLELLGISSLTHYQDQPCSNQRPMTMAKPSKPFMQT